MRLDLGDVQLDITAHVPGLRRYGIRLHVGAPRDTTAADRTPRGRLGPTPRKVDFIMDLMADKQVDVDVQWTDEIGHPVDAPAGATVSWTTDNPTVVAVTQHEDGTATVAATGELGTANVSVSVSHDGRTFTGDAQVNVVAGLAERVNIVFGAPTEVTPDEPPAEPAPVL
ncbi:MAG TPA: Ig-like domain-containing protein [Kofleriaceae bacterium]